MRQVLVYPGEDGFWVAECPSLPGCIGQGSSREEAASSIREAIELYLGTLTSRGRGQDAQRRVSDDVIVTVPPRVT